MQRIKTGSVVDGPGPSEKVATISTSTGTEEVVLHASTLNDSLQMEVGVLGYGENNMALIELPRESASGKWRVWVEKSELI